MMNYRIFILFISFFLPVQLLTIAALSYLYKTNQELQSVQRFNAIEGVYHAVQSSKDSVLDSIASVVAEEIGERRLSFGSDQLLVSLDRYIEMVDAQISLAIDTEGNVKVVRHVLDDFMQKSDAKLLWAMNDLSRQKSTMSFIKVEDVYYQFDTLPIYSGNRFLGWVGFGVEVDEQLAKHWRDYFGASLALVVESERTGVIASSMMPEDMDHGLSATWFAQESGQLVDVFSKKILLSETNGNNVAVYLAIPKRGFIAQARANWQFLAAFSLFAVCISLIAAYWYAKSLARPMNILARQVDGISRGNYKAGLQPRGSMELSRLAGSLDKMREAISNREQEIVDRATHDALTHLPNRDLLVNRMISLSSQDAAFRLLLINIQRLSDINFSLGYGIGDKILIECAKRLQDLVGSDNCFHGGGSHFYVISHDEESIVTSLMNRIDEEFKKPFVVNKISLMVGFKGSYIDSHEARGSAGQFHKKVGIALHYAKRSGRIWRRYEKWMSENIVEKFHIINAFDEAITNNQFSLQYQPKLDLNIGKVTAVEALIRWRHPSEGFISPERFISIAEETGHIHQITYWVIDAAVKQYKRWKDHGLDIQVAVNVSVENIKQKGFDHNIIKILKENGVPATALKIEVTESVVADNIDSVISVLDKLRDYGISLSIDDYGTGYSSLSQLKKLPVHELKIDRSFVACLLDDEQDKFIVESTIALAHSFGLKVVAEGVETGGSVNALKAMSCDFAQGYHISKPLSGDELSAWVKSN